MKASDRLLIDRLEVNRMLHLPKNLSYAILPRSLFRGKVVMSDVREMMRRSARNGAAWDGGEVIDISQAVSGSGISGRTLFRALRKAPHFRVSRKVALIDKCDLLIALLKGGKHE